MATGIIQIPVTEIEIEDIIVNSFEGGINYWAGIDNTLPEWKPKPKDTLDGYIVALVDSIKAFKEQMFLKDEDICMVNRNKHTQ